MSRIACTSRRLWPVMLAISASVAPTRARRVTAVPRRSWNVTPCTPAAAHALRHDARKPSDVHGLPSLLVSMIGERFSAASSAAFSGAPDEDHHRLAALGLPQPDVLAVVGRPGQPQEIALPLPGPEREQDRERQVCGCACELRGLVGSGPDFLAT